MKCLTSPLTRISGTSAGRTQVLLAALFLSIGVLAPVAEATQIGTVVTVIERGVTGEEVTAFCPAGMVALSGGVYSDSTLAVVGSYPRIAVPGFPGNIIDRPLNVPDGVYAAPVGWSGWVELENTTLQFPPPPPTEVTVVAVCSAVSGALTLTKHSSVGSGGVSGSINFNSSVLTCPSGTVATGGGIQVDNTSSMGMTHNGPLVNSGTPLMNVSPGTYAAPTKWFAGAFSDANLGGAWAMAEICAPLDGVSTVVGQTGTANPGYRNIADSQAVCPAGDIAVGGGYQYSRTDGSSLSSQYLIAVYSEPSYSAAPVFPENRSVGQSGAPSGWDGGAWARDNTATATVRTGVICATPGSTQTPSCTPFLDPQTRSFTISGGNGSVQYTVGTPSLCNFTQQGRTATTNDPWIHVTDTTFFGVPGTVNYVVDPNPGAAREGTITVAGLPHKVIQGGTTTFALTLTKAGTGSGIVTGTGINCGSDCAESYPGGSQVSLTVTPSTGSTFAGWSGDCSSFGTQSLCTLTMNAAKNVTATFNSSSTASAFSLDYVQKAYVAYYGRPADPGGQGYWATEMDKQGKTLNAIIGSFGNSEEFNRRYGGLSYPILVTKIYQQALARDPDQGGLDYYVGELQAGRRTLQSITLDVLNGATTAPDSTVVANKLEVAAYYTTKVAAGCPYGTEQDGVNAILGVTAISATVTAAKQGINTRCGP